MRYKIPKLSIFRFVIQVLFFIIMPGLFDLTFTGLKHAYLMIISGNINISQLLPDLLEVLIIIPITILFGRSFCGWLCAFGAFNDFLYAISKRVFRMKIRIPERLDSFLKYLKYVILIFIVSVIWTSGNNFFSGLSPWEAFAQLSELPGALFQYSAGFIILLTIVLGAILVERFFCRYLCPLGAIFSVVSRVRPLKIEKYKANCGACKLCTNNCLMGIPLYKMDKVITGECINCFKCIETCPRKNPQAIIFNERINSAFAGAVVIAAFTAVYSIGNVVVDANSTMLDTGNSTQVSTASNSKKVNPSPAPESTPVISSKTTENTPSPSLAVSQSTPTPKSMYADGTYEGAGTGHRSGLQISVTISKDKITDIQILSDRETPRYSMYAFNTVPQEILRTQSTNVDAVSGATETSDGIMSAVKDALSKARA